MENKDLISYYPKIISDDCIPQEIKDIATQMLTTVDNSQADNQVDRFKRLIDQATSHDELMDLKIAIEEIYKGEMPVELSEYALGKFFKFRSQSDIVIENDIVPIEPTTQVPAQVPAQVPTPQKKEIIHCTQVGAFKNTEEAKKEKNYWNSVKFPSYVWESKTDEYVKICLGKYKNKTELETKGWSEIKRKFPNHSQLKTMSKPLPRTCEIRAGARPNCY